MVKRGYEVYPDDKPSTFLQDLFHIWQGIFIAEVREALVSNDSVDLFLSLLLCFGKAEHSGEENVDGPHCRISARYITPFVSAICQLHDAPPTNKPAKTVPAVSLMTSC